MRNQEEQRPYYCHRVRPLNHFMVLLLFSALLILSVTASFPFLSSVNFTKAALAFKASSPPPSSTSPNPSFAPNQGGSTLSENNSASGDQFGKRDIRSNSLGREGNNNSGFAASPGSGNSSPNRAGLNTNFSLIRSWGSKGIGDGQFFNPNGIALDSFGNVYVVDSYTSSVQKFSNDGKLIGKLNLNTRDELNFPRDIAVDTRTGSIYVTFRHSIEEFDSKGTFVKTFVKQFGVVNGVKNVTGEPDSIAVDSSGTVYVMCSCPVMYKYDKDGALISSWLLPGFNPDAYTGPNSKIAVDNSGNIYATDDTNDLIYKFSSGGKLLAKWGFPEKGIRVDPAGIAVNSAGNVYVTDRYNNNTQIFDSKGNFILTSIMDQLQNPAGIAVDHSGNLYIIDQHKFEVRIYSPNHHNSFTS